MSVSDAEHQNQYFVDTGAKGVGPATYFYELFRKKSLQSKIEDLEQQIVELKDKLQTQTRLTETFRESNNRLQTNRDSKIPGLEAQISELSSRIEKFENSKLQNLCKETTFACELLKMAVESVPQVIVSEDKDLRVLAACIQNYIKQHASLAEDSLKFLQINTDENGNLKDGHNLDMVLLTDDQHEVFKILLELMFRMIKHKHFNTKNVYKYVMTDYYNTHAGNSLDLIKPKREVDEMLNAEENGTR